MQKNELLKHQNQKQHKFWQYKNTLNFSDSLLFFVQAALVQKQFLGFLLA
jgi:hypothetical protein